MRFKHVLNQLLCTGLSLGMILTLSGCSESQPAPEIEKSTPFLTITDGGYLSTVGSDEFNVFMYDNTFSGIFKDQHMGGIELSLHGLRIATNGDIHYLPTPEQWDATPAPSAGEIIRDTASNTITVPMTGSPDGTLEYNLIASLPLPASRRCGFRSSSKASSRKIFRARRASILSSSRLPIATARSSRIRTATEPMMNTASSRIIPERSLLRRSAPICRIKAGMCRSGMKSAAIVLLHLTGRDVYKEHLLACFGRMMDLTVSGRGGAPFASHGWKAFRIMDQLDEAANMHLILPSPHMPKR